MSISVLIVDDMATHLRHFQHLFLQLGVYTLTAASAEEALVVVQKSPVDAIFLDYNMPGMNGFDFVNAYKNLDVSKHAPIIMMSTDMAINQLAVQVGHAKAWVVKRATRDMVENALREVGVW
ncbi:MAG: response regulator [Alphaproteobacteria bacterium]|nr:response regulator [Alphaproteobacteria bacterium]